LRPYAPAHQGQKYFIDDLDEHMVGGVWRSSCYVLVPEQDDGGRGDSRVKSLGLCLAASDRSAEDHQPHC
jgi:hypothetical protein